MKRLILILLCILLLSSGTAAYAQNETALQILGCQQDGSKLDVLLYVKSDAEFSEKNFSVGVNKTQLSIKGLQPFASCGTYGTSWIVLVEPPAYQSISTMVSSLVEAMMERLGERDNLAVINGVTGEMTALTRDAAAVMPFVMSALGSRGGVRLYDAVHYAVRTFLEDPTANPHRCLLLISEGVDTNSYTTLGTAGEEIAGNGITVYSVGITRGIQTYIDAFQNLQALSGATESGLAFAYNDFPDGTGAQAAERICKNENNCYVLSADLLGSVDTGVKDAVLGVSLGVPKMQKLNRQAEHISIDPLPLPAHEHTWEEATCSRPRICSGCGEKEGEAVEHRYGDDGVCVWCGAPAHPVLHWLQVHLILCAMALALTLLLIALLIVLIVKNRAERQAKAGETAMLTSDGEADGGGNGYVD